LLFLLLQLLPVFVVFAANTSSVAVAGSKAVIAVMTVVLLCQLLLLFRLQLL